MIMYNRIITENQLDQWVRSNARDAQGFIVELVFRLVAASSPNPKERRFPLGDSIGQPGPDGVLNTDFGLDPFVPEGSSFWQIGTGIQAGSKATSDYKNLVKAIPAEVRQESTFIFVTPLSGRRDWPYIWKEDAQADWLEERRQRNDWRDVRVIDGSGLIDWLYHFPAVEQWLAERMGLPARRMQTPEQRWAFLRSIGDPPLTPDVFLMNREAACEKLKEVFAGTTLQLRLDTHFPEQVADFVAAYVATMDDTAWVDAVGRCLIICAPEAWEVMTALRERHILIADFDLNEADSAGARLLQKARRAGHAVIFRGMPGGIPQSNCVPIPNPKIHQMQDALEKAGYKQERARIFVQKSNANLSALLRVLQGFSLVADWAQGTDAAELAIAELLGAWREDSVADQAVVKKLSGEPYVEWIAKIREIALRPGTPVIQRNGVWKFVTRYEGWYSLGPRLFDEHIDRLKVATVDVLSERDPQFELPPDERYAASIHGKVLAHSRLLRNGLAQSLALLGSQPKALTSCSFGKAEATASLTVREVLADADWVLWASLNDLLPLLAEAAPGEFLDAVEKALNSDPCPFDTVFAQEGSGITGGNYMTGLLWGLETLAWDAEYLTRVVIILGELAARDPGGNWTNRPANSLSTILLPWLPQTCAPVAKRKAAVATLMHELPDVAWQLLMSLLPRLHQSSSGSRKPAWREMIPVDWSEGATHRDYCEQTAIYAELAINAAKNDLSKLADLIDRLDDLPPHAHEQLLSHLGSDTIASMPQAERLPLWAQLTDLVSKHRKFADAEWAMEPEQVNKIAALAERLAPEAPALRYRRLFSEQDFNLYEEKGNYEKQRNELEARRQRAVDEIFATGGVQVVLAFAKAVESPWRVGITFGMVAEDDVDREVLPELMETQTKSLAQFVEGFVQGRFRNRGWQWVDAIDTSKWTLAQIGQLLAYLPFTPETWERSARLLREDESPYWTKTNANPYETEKGLEVAVSRLIKHGRPYAAIRCLHRMQHDKQPLHSDLAVRALLAALDSSESVRVDVYDIVEIIKALQDDPGTNPEALMQIEWAYLPLFDRHHGAYPKFLGQRLADDPDFFCHLIRTVFRSKNDERPSKEPTEQQRSIAANAYRLLHNWRTPPGSQKDGTYDGDALTAWLEHVKAVCTETGHLEIALTMVGHVLIHTPPDPGGLWIHHSAAAALNARDASDMRDGFQTALFNSRGVHAFTAGREERELAAKYRRQADEVESRGYHRLANALRKLAASYELDAEREASRHPFDE